MKSALVVEDIAETRAWLMAAVQEAFPVCDVREARDRRQGLHAAGGVPVDLAVVDLGLPDGSGIDVIARLHELQPQALIVVATVMGDDASIIAALAAGAQGYLLKDTPQDLFVRQLAQLAQGLPALSPSVARRILSHFRDTAAPAESAADLTAREREVLGLVGRGLRTAEVARALGLTESTVASYVKTIYAKLGVNSRVEAARRAARMGLA